MEYMFYNDKVYRLGRHGYYITGHNIKYLHLDIWEYYNGPIPEGHIVHHKDLNKLNNDIDNLQLMTRSEHIRLHNLLSDRIPPSRKGRKSPGSGRKSTLTDEEKRLRKNEWQRNHRPSRKKV